MRNTIRVGTAALAGSIVMLTGCAGRGDGAGAGNGASVSTSSASASVSVDEPAGSSSARYATGSSAADTGEPVGIDELAGRTYLSTAVTGRTLVDGTAISLRFGGGELTANVGCNTMSGTYGTEDGGLTVGDLGATEIGCPSALSEQDTWLAEFLGGRPAWALDGNRLTLVSGSTTIELTDRKVADPDRPLPGTTWQLTGLIHGDTASSAPADPAVHLRLADGELKLWNDCAVAIGRYAVDGTTLDATVPEPADESSCVTDLLGVAADVLGSGTAVAIEADQLRLLAADGRGLMFTEADEVQAPFPPTGTSAGGVTG